MAYYAGARVVGLGRRRVWQQVGRATSNFSGPSSTARLRGERSFATGGVPSEELSLKALATFAPGTRVTAKGWIRSVRKHKSVAFIELNDGSMLSSLQAVVDDVGKVEALTTGCSVKLSGELKQSPKKKNGPESVELLVEEVELVGDCPAELYPLQKKGHSLEFLREIAHLRPRSNFFSAATRVRSRASHSIHKFFEVRDFLQVHSPIITSNDAEGSGELFRVMRASDAGDQKTLDDFFGCTTFLTVSGQLEAEMFACGLSKVYTFGPTFRAENSQTSRHLAEFWMVEPEIAFADLESVSSLAESCLKYVVTSVLNENQEDLHFFDQRVEKGLIDRLSKSLDSPIPRLSYTEAIEVLQKVGRSRDWKVQPHWGMDLGTEHERYLAEEYINGAVFITDYPRDIKAFYMRENDDGKTVAALDLLVPRIGELVGGSVREERFDVLADKMKKMGILPGAVSDGTDLSWYLDLRRFGTVPHGGWGMGFERLLQYLTGIENIRDTIPVPRFPYHCKF